mgnify:CR=1 FL=1
MNSYDFVKDNVSVPQAAERYGLTIGRGGMVSCPFHEDRHPSMKLNERYFYCFGCGAHGDVIDLTAQLLGTTTKDTIRILLNDFGLDPEPGSSSRPPQPRRPAIYQLRQDEQRCFTVLTSFHRMLEDWKVQYAPASPDDPLDDHYILACQQMEGIEYALDILTVGEAEERVKLVDGLIKSGRLDRLRQAMNAIKEGERYVDSRAS